LSYFLSDGLTGLGTLYPQQTVDGRSNYNKVPEATTAVGTAATVPVIPATASPIGSASVSE